ncbi:MAG: lysylphosphatidylglycerol synthase domain-containing protein [Solirubrobacteraceae bacterium]|nr:lysylphosphatidylglycerol synthase domain-containing protein [Solirubrobacteraceae bacterium]
MIIASFLDDLSGFFSNLGHVKLVPLLVGMALFVVYLSFRALAFRNILQDAYPHENVPYPKVWGAYLAAYGFNNVIPARGGDVLKVYLTKTSIPGSSYPTIGAALLVEAIFDLCAGGVAVLFAISIGVFPDPPSWVSLDSFDLSFVVSDGRRALFLVTAIVIGVLVLFALVALRVRLFWARVRQGFAVLRDRRRYMKRVWGIQGLGWLVRGSAFFFFLQAFGLPATVENVFLVLSANAVAAVFPFTPGGAGVVQALLVVLLSGQATKDAIAAYGVGQQATIAVLSLAVGFVALASIFQIRSFKEVIARGQEDRRAEKEAERAKKAGEDVAAFAASDERGPGFGGGAAETDTETTRPGRRRRSAEAEPAGPSAVDSWLDEVDATIVRPGPPPPVEPDGWLDEELAPDRAREQRREDRARWRRRQRRD